MSKTPSHLTKAQVVRRLGLENYYELAPIIKRAAIKIRRYDGTLMIDIADLPKLIAIRKAMGK